jgi:hypothetical protein
MEERRRAERRKTATRARQGQSRRWPQARSGQARRSGRARRAGGRGNREMDVGTADAMRSEEAAMARTGSGRSSLLSFTSVPPRRGASAGPAPLLAAVLTAGHGAEPGLLHACVGRGAGEAPGQRKAARCTLGCSCSSSAAAAPPPLHHAAPAPAPPACCLGPRLRHTRARALRYRCRCTHAAPAHVRAAQTCSARSD